MNTIALVDTSIWTHALRRDGDPAIRQRIEILMAAERAVWCDAVRLELWAGVRADERAKLRKFEVAIRRLPINDAVWTRACRLADVGRDVGLTVPANDVLIYACAQTFGVELVHADKHFDKLATLYP